MAIWVVGTCVFSRSPTRVSCYWQMRTLEFDGRQIVELLPPVLLAASFAKLSLDEQDEAYFAFLASDAFKDTCALLRDEFA